MTENKRNEESRDQRPEVKGQRSTRRRAKGRRLRSHLGAQHPRKPAAEEQPGGEEDRKASLCLTDAPSSVYQNTEKLTALGPESESVGACSHLDMEFSEVRSLGDRTALKLRLGCETAGKVGCDLELKPLFVFKIIRRDKRSSPVTWWTFFTVDLSFWEPSLGPPILQAQGQRSRPGC